MKLSYDFLDFDYLKSSGLCIINNAKPYAITAYNLSKSRFGMNVIFVRFFIA